MKTKTLKVDYLARVEGEGALYVKIKDKSVSDVKLKIFEPPRFFEAFLRGRNYGEAPDITARICGICPIAYQMSAVHAIEDAFGVKVDGQLRALRRLIYCGEWIESHALHIYMLHAPDFLGYEDAIRMAKDYPEIVQRGLQLKKIGNEIVSLVGGREIHPINVRVGGFYRVPTKRELAPLAERLKWAREAALETVRWTTKLKFPPFEQDYEFVALRHPDEYPFNEGRLVSNKGLDIAVQEYENHFAEEQVEHSNALHSVHRERGAYCVGPLARYNLNFDKLTPLAQQAARDAGLGPACRNPFQSISVRSVETLYACDEALRIIEAYEMPEKPAIEIQPRAAAGHGCTEAPRGILYHRYRLDEHGVILDAKIVPPTSQNQKTIENDLRQFVPKHLNLADDKLTWQCEQAIRNYDPCISCATHFLKLEIDRE
ncbi:MAG: Ni/Fe hydrogenase subunit alpha [candidate division KSB1 bacterium]|nr:Ni/Fe hydrogenase subunit alpha [candidate division KSB1 bacterium]MDZ7369275.1 Ni/Fe hydrogenase subunit alpha [candidate division KSB1 bacterium]MDZ7407310.1 Ni/Fe hydrogenase subunit alpha [candidate division KSB1 bacterium]